VPEYTLLTVLAVVLVVSLDLVVVRTRLLATLGFWLTLTIMWVFQIPVDGWLTRLDAAIVRYDERHFSGVRVFFDSPIEDFGFGFAMVLATLMVWTVLSRRSTGAEQRRPRRAAAGEPSSGIGVHRGG